MPQRYAGPAEALAARIEDVTNDLSERLNLSDAVASAAEKVELLDGEAKAAGASCQQKEAEIRALQEQERALA